MNKKEKNIYRQAHGGQTENTVDVFMFMNKSNSYQIKLTPKIKHSYIMIRSQNTKYKCLLWWALMDMDLRAGVKTR